MKLFRQPYIVVLRQLGGVGDVLMMSCVYRGLREKYPKHKICLATGNVYLGGSLTDIAEHNPFIDEVHTYEPWDATTEATRVTWTGNFDNSPDIANDLWWQKADITIDLNTACVEYEWPALHTPEGIRKPRTHIWCERAGVTPSSYDPIYVIRPEEAEAASRFFEERGWDPQECVAVAVAACDPKRALGRGKLEQICHGIKNIGLRPVVVDPTFRFEGIDAINGIRIRDLMPILQKMKVGVSADSGLLHMCGTVGTPIVGLFGPTDPDMRMGPYLGSAIDARRLVDCSPCWYLFPCMQQGKDPKRRFECLNRIPVDAVVEEVRRWANYSGTKRRLSAVPMYNGG